MGNPNGNRTFNGSADLPRQNGNGRLEGRSSLSQCTANVLRHQLYEMIKKLLDGAGEEDNADLRLSYEELQFHLRFADAHSPWMPRNDVVQAVADILPVYLHSLRETKEPKEEPSHQEHITHNTHDHMLALCRAYLRKAFTLAEQRIKFYDANGISWENVRTAIHDRFMDLAKNHDSQVHGDFWEWAWPQIDTVACEKIRSRLSHEHS